MILAGSSGGTCCSFSISTCCFTLHFMLRRRLLSFSLMNQPLITSGFSCIATSPLSASVQPHGVTMKMGDTFSSLQPQCLAECWTHTRYFNASSFCLSHKYVTFYWGEKKTLTISNVDKDTKATKLLYTASGDTIW